MNRQEAARLLEGNEYRQEGSPELFAAMKAAGLVAVFGASDDLVEFRGAIDDEEGAYGGGTTHVDSTGLLVNECNDANCPHFDRLRQAAVTIEVKWDDGGFSWRYESAIPHDKFVILEEGEPYCEGIVFALADARPDGA